MKEAIGVSLRQLADVKRDVEIQGIRAIAFNLQVARIRPKGLQRCGQRQRDTLLIGPDEHDDLEGMPD
ncbi:hypothetical protein D9M68_853000 [compost metagenome]